MPSIGIVIDAERTGFAALRRLCRRRGTVDTGELVAAGELIDLAEGASIEIGALPDGRVVVAQSSLQLLLTAADALRAKYGDPRVGEPGQN